MILQGHYAAATKEICIYFQRIRGLFINSCPKILKLVDKEIVGVLQQKLVKLMVIKLETSYEGGVNQTEHWLRLILNLLKCSPPEAEVHTQLCYRSLDSIVFELLLKARANHFKIEI